VITRRCFAASLLASAVRLPAAVRGEKAAYVGGTIKTTKPGQQGYLDVDLRTVMTFIYKGGALQIPYKDITEMEFGQKVGRRVGSTIALGVTTLGIMALPMLFSKKKSHFLTINFNNDAGEGEVVVMELAKGIVRTVIPILQVRTGKAVVLQPENSR
jgi:hypothetical protein